MNRKNFLKKLLLGLSILIILIEGLWLIAVPENLIIERIISYLPPSMEVNMEGLKKGLFFNLSVERLTVKEEQIEVNLRDLKASLYFPSLFRGQLEIVIKAFTGQRGSVQGLVSPSGNIRVKVDGVNLSSIKNPFLKGEAMIFMEGEIINKDGTIRFYLKEARLEPVREGGLSIPLNYIDTIRGILHIKEKEITLESVNLSGKDIYGRLKGKIRDKEADLILELMPEKDMNRALLLMMPSHMVSPGYYRMEIKRRL